MLKQIEEERARLEADFLKIQMQTCLEEAKKKKEEQQGQLVQSHSAPSPDEQNRVEHEVKNCGKLCVVFKLLFYYYLKIKSTICQF